MGPHGRARTTDNSEVCPATQRAKGSRFTLSTGDTASGENDGRYDREE